MGFYTGFYHKSHWVAPLKSSVTFDDLALETDRFAFFEEGKGYHGLKSFLQIGKTFIFDNHHHALFFWYQHLLLNPQKLIHVDQHSDRADNPYPFDLNWLKTDCSSQVFDFVQEKTHVGNFITPVLNLGLFTEYVEIRTEQTFMQYSFDDLPYVLDIDLDFRAPEMGITFSKTLSKLQKLIDGASLVTIATSPYFLDQKIAFALLSQLKLL